MIEIPKAKKYAELHSQYVGMATSFVHFPLPGAVESAQIQALGEILDDIHLMLRQLLTLNIPRDSGSTAMPD
jgi:hypothetical protein